VLQFVVRNETILLQRLGAAADTYNKPFAARSVRKLHVPFKQ
jgi:hypothetical protein